ncbi:hypothetical protein [Methylocystis echinoides]|uniref:hypothetical protein n=1 Tax=Methylocystis echinoides TaxID=29468 RepID=UPI00343A6702
MSVIAKLIYFSSLLPGGARSAAPPLSDRREPTIGDPFERAVVEFQRHIEDSKNDSTAFSGRDLYIYLHLIRSWFKYLSLKHQNDPATIQNMKENYVEYILCMKEMQKCGFIFVKGGGAETYRDRYAAAKKIKEEIERAFADALGDEAARELKTIKDLPCRCFNRHGDKAPEGYWFSKYETDVEKIPDAESALT